MANDELSGIKLAQKNEMLYNSFLAFKTTKFDNEGNQIISSDEKEDNKEAESEITKPEN